MSRTKRTIDVAIDIGKKLLNAKLNFLKGIFGKNNNKKPPSPPSNYYPSNNYPSGSYPSQSYPSVSYPSSSYPSTISSPSSVGGGNCYKIPKRKCQWVPYKQECKKNDKCKPKPTTECKKECKNVYNCYDCPNKKPTPIK